MTGTPTFAPGCAFAETERSAVAAANAGASFTSLTRIVKASVSVASRGSLTVTITLCDGATSWFSTAPSATVICPCATSISNRSEPVSVYISESPSASVACSGSPTRVCAAEFSGTVSCARV